MKAADNGHYQTLLRMDVTEQHHKFPARDKQVEPLHPFPCASYASVV